MVDAGAGAEVAAPVVVPGRAVPPAGAVEAEVDGTGPALYVAGYFTAAGGVTATNIAKWDGASWSALGPPGTGTNNLVNSLAVYDDGAGPALYAGGYFTTAGGLASPYLAKWAGCAGCYANCDSSTVAPVLNVADFICFTNRFAASSSSSPRSERTHITCDDAHAAGFGPICGTGAAP